MLIIFHLKNHHFNSVAWYKMKAGHVFEHNENLATYTIFFIFFIVKSKQQTLLLLKPNSPPE